MTPRFRMVAGPNGSGKTTLARRLAADYAVNFYTPVNPDDIFAEVSRTGRYAPGIALPDDLLKSYAAIAGYSDDVRRPFRDGQIRLENDCVRFAADAVNSYTVALFADFLRTVYIEQRVSFSQETVLSHPSKVEALKAARDAGFRTYLYFVATESPEVNLARVANRSLLGGHDVPRDKIVSRYSRSLANAAAALPYLSRAFFFDNSSEEMRYIGEWNEDLGFSQFDKGDLPAWFTGIVRAFLPNPHGVPRADGEKLSDSARAASREAVAQAIKAGLSVTVMRDGHIVKIAPDGKESVVFSRTNNV